MELITLTNGFAPEGWIFDRFADMWKDAALPGEGVIAPQADVVEDDGGYHFYVEMPGVQKNQIDVRVEEDRLVIEAERKRPEWPKNTEIHLVERGYGKLRRAFRLPEDAARDDVKASYHEGVLEVTVARRAEARPRRIKVEFDA